MHFLSSCQDDKFQINSRRWYQSSGGNLIYVCKHYLRKICNKSCIYWRFKCSTYFSHNNCGFKQVERVSEEKIQRQSRLISPFFISSLILIFRRTPHTVQSTAAVALVENIFLIFFFVMVSWSSRNSLDFYSCLLPNVLKNYSLSHSLCVMWWSKDGNF